MKCRICGYHKSELSVLWKDADKIFYIPLCTHCYDNFNICNEFKKLAVTNAGREAFNKFRIYYKMVTEFEVEMVYTEGFVPLRGARLNDHGRGGGWHEFKKNRCYLKCNKCYTGIKGC